MTKKEQAAKLRLIKCKEAIKLYEVEKLSPTDVAKAVGWNLKKLRTNLRTVLGYTGLVIRKTKPTRSQIEVAASKHMNGSTGAELARKLNISDNTLRLYFAEIGYDVKKRQFSDKANVTDSHGVAEVRASKADMWNKLLSNKNLKFDESRELCL